jgi:hypothetical protein
MERGIHVSYAARLLCFNPFGLNPQADKKQPRLPGGAGLLKWLQGIR